MKLKKSFYSLLLAILLVLNSLGIVIPETAFGVSTNSIAPENYGQAINRVAGLGIIDNGNVNPNSVITRGQLCKAIVVAAGLDDTAKSRVGPTIFSDIDVTSEISGYVNTVIDNKLMSGMADGKFHPEQAVTFAQACTMLVRALGYTDQDVSGLWPMNYINKASALNLTDSIKLGKNDGLPVWAAAVMFDRLLNTNVKGQTKTYLKTTSLYDDYIILDNPNTSSNVASGSVVTNQGVLYTSDINTSLEVGSTYRLKVTNGNIGTVYGKVRNTQGFTVNNAVGNTVYYNSGNTLSSMTLPSGIEYYHHDQTVSYTSLSNILKPDTEIVFNYNTDNGGYDYAVIIDPIYSNPQIALNFDSNSNTLGDITFDSNTPIIRSGQSITKNDIRDYDAVYSVADANGKNRTIQVFDNIIEGNITGFLANDTSSASTTSTSTSSASTTSTSASSKGMGIMIDKVSYYYGTGIDLSNLSSLKVGDLVSATKGYDGSIIAVRSIDHKTGNLTDGIIVGNSKTDSSLKDNQVQISTNGNTLDKYTCLSGIGNFEIGAEYSFYADNDAKTVTKINKKINSVEDYAVSSVSDSIVSYISDNNDIKTMTLPYVSNYYYKGVKVDYSTALSSIQPYSSIIVGKNNDGTGDLYAVIADPCFSKPQVYRPSNTNLMKQLDNADYSFIYKGGVYTADPSNIKVYDVVYFVSDLWNKASYVYDYDKTVVGSITALSPSTTNPTSITVTVGTKSYDLNQYFDKSKLHNFDAISHPSSGDNFYVGSSVILILGVDGTIVDLYQK